MTVFEDASAIVARYTAEPGRPREHHHSVVVVSGVSQVEVSSAIWRKQRMGDLSPGQARVLVDAFLADLSPETASTGEDTVTYLPVAVGAQVLDTAVALCGTHTLRAYDAVQLASAVQARAADPSLAEFVTYDEALNRAAAVEGFRVNPLR